WDYGHWLLYYNGDKIRVSSDNVHGSPLNIWTTARAFTHTTSNDCRARQDVQNMNCPASPEDLERAELESIELMRPMKTTHILIDKEIVGGGSGGKFNALEHIAQNQVGCFQTVGCQETNRGGQCLIGQNEKGENVGLTLNETAWRDIMEARWPGMPLNDYGVPTRGFVKKDSSGATLYMSALACGRFFPHPLAPSLFAFQNRIFFNDPSLKYVKKVFDNKWIVIYEIDWNAVDNRNRSNAGNASS
ncbi:hypothetical protein HY546_00225, partial [archaeon]|nr:hypothetical protein [archaeon]